MFEEKNSVPLPAPVCIEAVVFRSSSCGCAFDFVHIFGGTSLRRRTSLCCKLVHTRSHMKASIGAVGALLDFRSESRSSC